VSTATRTSLVETLAGEIGVRVAGSDEAHRAADVVADAFRGLGLAPSIREFRFLGFRPEPPELIVDGEVLDAGPCLYAPADSVEGEVRFLGELVLRRGAFETPVFAIGEHARLYVNTRGPAVPLPAPVPANLGGPAAWIGAADGARLRSGDRAALRTGGELVPNQLDLNVIAEIPGATTEAILVCAHTDSVWRGPGAVDNASGCEALLRVAERFRGTARQRSLILAAFGAEELGLLGSTHYVAEARVTGELARVAAIVNLDSVARGDALEVLASDALRPYLDGVANVGAMLPGSDHWPFVQAGVPGVALTYHPYPEYHTPADTPEIVDLRKLEESVEVACAIVERLLR
jgi:aminopeptidase YwaD